MVYKDSFMGEFRLTWGNIGWMPEILRHFVGVFHEMQEG